MSAKTILTALFFFFNIYSFSQQRLIQCTTQNNPDKSVSIYANSQAYTDYTLKISFTNLNGYTSPSISFSNIALVTVSRGNAEALKLTPTSSMNPAIQYRYQFFPGHSFSKTPDTSFHYLLPASAGSHVRVTSVSSTVSQLSQRMGTEFRGTGFLYKLNDTICASRAGIVYECSDTATVGEKTDVIYKSGRNRIIIEHRDGTIGNYGITAPIHLLVKSGDEVFPGQPLAFFNKESPKYYVIFSVSYLDEKKVLSDNSFDNTLFYIHMCTYFYAKENDRSSILQTGKDYTVQHPKDIIAAEMTKKEKKKFGF